MASEKTKTKIQFALVSIRDGRAGIRKRLAAGEQPVITITGRLVSTWSRDDGTDQEFAIDVTAHEVAS